MTFGENLKEFREKSGLNKLQLSQEIGTSHQNVCRWENNECSPSIDFCIKLADFYGISLDELVGREFGHND